MSKSNVFVTDAQMRSSLAVIRSLGKKGLHVTAGDETRCATGLFSKYCSKKIVYPSPQKNEKQFLNFLLNELRNNTYQVLFPVADFCLKPIIENEERLSQYTTIALPPRDTFSKGYDKGETLKIALKNEIPCPKTYFIDSYSELDKLRDLLEYPLIIKPRISSGRRGVKICSSYEELRYEYRNQEKLYGKLLVQEYIPNGGEFGVYTLLNRNSELRAVTVQRRIRSYPIEGGPSTFRETIKSEITEYAIDLATKLLKAINWSGVAMVEFRIDPRSNTPKLMEINPRFWGSLQLSILSGIDFPYLLYQILTEGDIEPVMDYREGVQCRWLLPGEILWFLNSPNKIKNFPKLFDFKTNDDILSWSDPGPTFGFFFATARYLFDQKMWKFALRR